MSYMRGQWILHENGSTKLTKIAEAYFNGCLSRAKNHFPDLDSYSPWMSATKSLPRFSEVEELSNFDSPQSKFNSNSTHLSCIDHIVNKVIKLKVLSDFPELKILHSIEQDQPHLLSVFRKAVKLTENWDPWQKGLFDTIIHSVVPISSSAFSEKDVIGWTFNSFNPHSAFPDLTLNISLAHEMGHQMLMLYQYSAELIPESDAWIYSGLRKTLRPAISSLHAAVALAYMIECINSLLSSEPEPERINFLKERLEEYQNGLTLGLEHLKPIKKTPICELIIQDLGKSISRDKSR